MPSPVPVLSSRNCAQHNPPLITKAEHPQPVIPEAEALCQGYRGPSRKVGPGLWIPALRCAWRE